MTRKISALLTLLLCCFAPFFQAPALAHTPLENRTISAAGDPSPAAQLGDDYRLYLPVVRREYGFSASGLGPYTGRVLGMGQDPANPANLYAMTYGSGMYKSTDYGACWSPSSVGITNLTLQSMAVDPVNPNTVYAGAYGDAAVPYNGVYKSTNGGLTWSATGEMANVWNGVRYNVPIIYALAVDPLHPNRIFAGTRMRYLPAGSLGGGGVFRSENGGASWTPVNAGLPGVDLYIYDVYVDAARPGVVYAALHQHGLYRSDNYGNSWYPLNGTPYAGRAVSVDPYSSSTIFFGAVKKLGLNRSTNNGASWAQVGSGGWDVAVGAV
ncbi:MAG: hypothetical protein EHM21_07985, partial [Chloroflexi bacterium]